MWLTVEIKCVKDCLSFLLLSEEEQEDFLLVRGWKKTKTGWICPGCLSEIGNEEIQIFDQDEAHRVEQSSNQEKG